MSFKDSEPVNEQAGGCILVANSKGACPFQHQLPACLPKSIPVQCLHCLPLMHMNSCNIEQQTNTVQGFGTVNLLDIGTLFLKIHCKIVFQHVALG